MARGLPQNLAIKGTENSRILLLKVTVLNLRKPCYNIFKTMNPEL